jgi:FKBP-type peptidyl-prolyl cis-trans isomerase
MTAPDAPSMSPTQRLALIGAAVLLVATVGIAVIGVSDPAVAPPREVPVEPPAPTTPWKTVDRTDHGDGLASAVLVPGSGPSPKVGEVVEIDVQGWLEATSAQVAHETGARRVLGAHDMVEGIERLLPDMKVGETRQVRVPAALGFGQTGRPPRIPRDADLVYELTLKGVSAARIAPTAPPAQEPDQETDGVRWVRLAEGAGEPPTAGQRAQVHFTIWLTDGTRIDSTLERQRPIGVTVGKGELYPGLDAAIATMRPGERRKLVVPPALAAGEAGRGPIPPGSALIFDVELLSVE